LNSKNSPNFIFIGNTARLRRSELSEPTFSAASKNLFDSYTQLDLLSKMASKVFELPSLKMAKIAKVLLLKSLAI